MSLWREYAADPAVFCRTWAECKLVLDGIGWDKGRLISELFPIQKWREFFRDSLENCDETPRNKLQIVEKFNQFIGTSKIGRLRNGLIPSSRPYTPKTTWLESALEAYASRPFDGIVALYNPANHPAVLILDDVEGTHPLWAVDSSQSIARDLASLKQAIDVFALLSSNLVIIDPYLDPADTQCVGAIEAYLDSMRAK